MTGVVIALSAVAWLLVVHAVVKSVLLRRPPSSPPAVRERVSVLVPARDEEQRIGRCVTALVAQRLLYDVEVLVLDDQSTDATGRVAAAAGGDRARVLPGAALPAGWLGKPHACAQLADAATGSVLVFVDADVEVAADGVARAVAQLRASGLALVSPYPRQVAGSWLERIVQPLLQWSWLTFLPVRLAERPALSSMTAANGQLLVVDAASYRAAGGHAAIRDRVIDDIALARAFKAAGLRVAVSDGRHLATCRMYDGPRALVDGYAKWMWTAFGSPAGAAVVGAMLVAVYVLPWVLTIWTPWAWVAAAAGPVGRLVSAARTGARPLGDAIAHPLSVLAFVSIVMVSVARHRAGGLRWKGRAV
jgi:hypothetical protein